MITYCFCRYYNFCIQERNGTHLQCVHMNKMEYLRYSLLITSWYFIFCFKGKNFSLNEGHMVTSPFLCTLLLYEFYILFPVNITTFSMNLTHIFRVGRPIMIDLKNLLNLKIKFTTSRQAEFVMYEWNIQTLGPCSEYYAKKNEDMNSC